MKKSEMTNEELRRYSKAQAARQSERYTNSSVLAGAVQHDEDGNQVGYHFEVLPGAGDLLRVGASSRGWGDETRAFVDALFADTTRLRRSSAMRRVPLFVNRRETTLHAFIGALQNALAEMKRRQGNCTSISVTVLSQNDGLLAIDYTATTHRKGA